MCVAKKYYNFFCFNWWICRDGQSITVYAPYWFEGQGVILEQEVCSTTPLKLKVIQKVVAPNHKRDGDGATSVKYEAIKKRFLVYLMILV